MKAIKKIIATAICLMMVMGLCICNPVSATEEPLLTVAFMSDLHNQQSTLESGNIRNSVTKVCDDLAANENTDVVVIGGDVTSDSYVSKPVLESVLGKVVNETNKDERLGDNIYQYLEQPGLEQLAKLYYTALGRERYGMYKLERNADELKQTYM